MGLAEHIATDPDNRGYAVMTGREVYDDLMLKRRPGNIEVSYKMVLGQLGAGSGRRLIDSMKTASASDSVIEVWHNMLVRGETINVDNAEVKAMLQSFVDAGLPLTQADKDGLVSLANNQVSDAQHHSLLPLTVHKVIEAKG